MALADDLPEGTHVAFDADAVIYYVEDQADFAGVVGGAIGKAAAGLIRAHVSVVTLMEVLVKPLRIGRNDLVETYRETLTGDGGFILHDLTPDVAERAAEIRAKTGLGTPDAS